MPKKLSLEEKLIMIFDDCSLQRAEILLGVAKALVARKRRIFADSHLKPSEVETLEKYLEEKENAPSS